MAFDEGLASRVRKVLERKKGITERKMFGGLAFMRHGHMCCGIEKEDLMLRVGPDQYDDCLGQPHARVMDFTGKPMKGMLYVAARGISEDEQLQSWIGQALSFVDTLPPK